MLKAVQREREFSLSGGRNDLLSERYRVKLRQSLLGRHSRVHLNESRQHPSVKMRSKEGGNENRNLQGLYLPDPLFSNTAHPLRVAVIAQATTSAKEKLIYLTYPLRNSFLSFPTAYTSLPTTKSTWSSLADFTYTWLMSMDFPPPLFRGGGITKAKSIASKQNKEINNLETNIETNRR